MVCDKRLELIYVSKITLHTITLNYWFIDISTSSHRLMIKPYRDKYRDKIRKPGMMLLRKMQMIEQRL